MEDLTCEGCGKKDKTVKPRWCQGSEFVGRLILCDECDVEGAGHDTEEDSQTF